MILSYTVEMKQTFPVRIFTADSEVFSGEVSSLSSVNSVGPFDILNLHSNFISLIEKEIVLRTQEGREKKFALNSGVLRCLETSVDVYAVMNAAS